MTYLDGDATFDVKFFDEWMKELDELLFEQTGLSIHDLTVMRLRAAWDAGVSPGDFFSDTVLTELVKMGWHEADASDPSEAE